MGEQVNKRGSIARLQVTPSKIPKKGEQSADPERRIAKRVLKIQPCVYQPCPSQWLRNRRTVKWARLVSQCQRGRIPALNA